MHDKAIQLKLLHFFPDESLQIKLLFASYVFPQPSTPAEIVMQKRNFIWNMKLFCCSLIALHPSLDGNTKPVLVMITNVPTKPSKSFRN